jgi:hypothetical protein
MRGLAFLLIMLTVTLSIVLIVGARALNRLDRLERDLNRLTASDPDAR